MQPDTDPIVRLDRDERLLAERHKPSRVTSQSRAQSRAVSLDDPSMQRVPDRGERRVESPRGDFNPFNEAAEDADTIEVSHTEPLARASQTPGSPDSASAADGLDMPAPREPELPLRAQSSSTVDGVTWSPSVLVRDPMATKLLDASGLLLADAGSAALGSELSGAASTSAAAGAATASATGGFLSMVWPAVLGVGSLAVLASSKHSSGSSPATPDTTTQPPTTPVTPQAVSYTISGGLMAGPILKPLKVTAYDAQGRELGTAMTVESSTGVIGFGNYTITFTDPSFTGGAVLLRVTDTDTSSSKKDKDFLDEATHASANITDLRAVVYVAPPAETTGKSSLSASVTAYITPLTTLAAEMIAPLPTTEADPWTLSSSTGDIAAAIHSSNQKVAAVFGLGSSSDVTALQPIPVMNSNASTNPDANAYGAALAVLSYAQSQDSNLTAKALTDALTTSSEGNPAFSEAVTGALKSASTAALAASLITPIQANDIQQATAGNPAGAVNFKFSLATWDVTPTTSLDPAKAFGQAVYQWSTSTDDPADASVNKLVLHNVNLDQVTFSLSGQDADAFDCVVDTGNNTVSLKLRDTSGADAAKLHTTAAFGAAGYTYHVTLDATADVLGTPDDTSDDAIIHQDLTLTVKDTTKPVLSTSPDGLKLTVKSIEGVLGVNNVLYVGKQAAHNAAGFLDLSGLLAPVDDPGVKYQVTMVLANQTPKTGTTGTTTLTVEDFNPSQPPALWLTDDQLKALGDGAIAVTTTVKAVDLAGNTSTPSVINASKASSFVLDTTAASPSPSLVGDVVTTVNGIKVHTSGTRKIQLNGLEVGSSVTYSVDGEASVTISGDSITSASTTLNLSALASGAHTLKVYQTDRVGNQSEAATLDFNLALEYPTGVDAQITQFATLTTGDDGVPVFTDVDPRLFWLNGNDLPAVSGVVHGALSSGTHLALGITNSLGVTSWKPITLSPAQLQELATSGEVAWNYTLSSLSGGSGVLSVGLQDNFGHTNVLTTRSYVLQDDNVLKPPSVAWLGAVETQTSMYQATSVLRVVTTGLQPHAMAQYQLLNADSGGSLSESGWSTTIPQRDAEGKAWPDGAYYLYVRQLDLLTGKTSLPSDPLSIDLDTTAPNTIASSVSSFAHTGLFYQPVDEGGSTLINRSTLADNTLIDDTDFHRARTVVVYNTWADADVGGTVFVRWGNVQKTHTLTGDDVTYGMAYVEWSVDEILNQPGNVMLQAWTTDLNGHTSDVTSRQFTVDPSYVAGQNGVNPVNSGAPQVLGWYTRTSSAADYALDADNTFNLLEAQTGVKLKVQLPKASDGSPLVWGNVGSGSNIKAFTLTLQAKSPTADWSLAGLDNMASRTFTVSDIHDGTVEWLLSPNIYTSLWQSPNDALRDWRVQVLNYSYGPTNALRLSETAASRVGVDLAAPQGVSLTVSDSANAVSMGLNQQELTVTVGYAGMAVGDVLVLQSQVHGVSGGGLDVLSYRLKDGDIQNVAGVTTVSLRLAREAIAQGRGDNLYDLGVVVTDAAGNSTSLSSGARPLITIDTQGPAAPTLSCAPGQDLYINDKEGWVDVVVTWPVGTTRLDSDQVRWVLGGSDFTKAVLQDTTSTSATYRFLKSDLGLEGVKDVRATLVDASGNLGAYSQVLSLVSDWQAHDAPTVAVKVATGNQAALTTGAGVTLDIHDAQMVAGDQVKVWVSQGAGAPVQWGNTITIASSDTPPTQTSITLMQAELASHFGSASGVYQVTATVTDLAGNESVASQPCNVVVDLVAPTNGVKPGTFGLQVHATTADAQAAYITSQAGQILSLELNAALQKATGDISAESLWARIVPQDAGQSATAWVDLSQSVSGTTLTWNTDTTSPTYSGLALLEGANTIHMQVRDQAGNVSASLFQQAYVLDTHSPVNQVVSGSFTLSADSAPTGVLPSTPDLGALAGDLKTRELTGQTLSLHLSAPLNDGVGSALGFGKEYLWGSLDGGAHWGDVSAFVSGTTLNWNTALAYLTPADASAKYGSYSAQFQVRDVAGNVGPTFSATYVLDQTGPVSRISKIQLNDDTGMDVASLHDFITNVATTSINFTLDHALATGERVYVQLGADQTPIDITADLVDAFTVPGTYTVENFTLLSGLQHLSVWVEDDVGNKGEVYTHDVVYASTPPALDLDGSSAATTWTHAMSAVAAQRGVGIGQQIGISGVLSSVGIEHVHVAFGVEGNSNGNSERLLVTPGLDISLSAASAVVKGLQIAGVEGYVTLNPGGGSELDFYKTLDAAGTQVAYFSDVEVSHLLDGLRYFNTAEVGAVETGTRTFQVQLTDRATNVSDLQTATLNLTSPASGEPAGADAGNNTLTGTAGDDLLFGLRGQDTLTGLDGNDTFMWLRGDAYSSAGVAGTAAAPIIDRVTDFTAWDAATQTGDRLDIAKLLEGYTSTSTLSNWVKTVENNVTFQDGVHGARLTIDVNGSATGGAIQVIELQGVTWGSSPSMTSAQLLAELVSTQQLKVL